jgi:hypothetical protein
VPLRRTHRLFSVLLTEHPSVGVKTVEVSWYGNRDRVVPSHGLARLYQWPPQAPTHIDPAVRQV